MTAILELLEAVTEWEEPRGCEQGEPRLPGGGEEAACCRENHEPWFWSVENWILVPHLLLPAG